MIKKVWLGLGVVIVLALGGFWLFTQQPPEIEPYTLQLLGGDAVASWDFAGAYTDKPELIEKAHNEIKRLSDLRGKKDESDYELYVSIANQYDLMGAGENELLYLRRALAVDATDTGLAWYNAAVLFERLKAYATARFAYEQAAKAQSIPQYISALADYLKAHPAISQ